MAYLKTKIASGWYQVVQIMTRVWMMARLANVLGFEWAGLW